ncbi:hypothetical protein SAMN05444338_1151 [Flavobacterium degerlachei]|jgi:hypothetical protein|uniref:Uncharacterized protein n=1 Tax=Flavobacterium degerlachei TaxID=229203 RepID=A0A1H3EFT0_9FLAO|nr:hypothetical protein SAMN05444338_1151 [Flavobacterium degerlachei]
MRDFYRSTGFGHDPKNGSLKHESTKKASKSLIFEACFKFVGSKLKLIYTFK